MPLACSRHQHQQSHGKAPKRRLRFLVRPQCRVRLQRGRQQQPAHKNERRGALDAAAAMRSNAPQNQQPFPAARVKHTAHASTGTTSAAHSTARAPLQQHLHFLHATPRHTLHYPRSPAPRRPVHHVHTGRRGGQSTARGRHAAAHDAHWHTRRKLREHVAEGRRRFFPMPLHAWRLPREEPRRRLHELERAHDVSVKLLARLQLAVGDEGK